MSTVNAIAPHSRKGVLAKLDRRTREARLMKQTRAELIAHVGGRPSATERMMIEQAAQLRLRLAVMDRAFGQSANMTEHDSRQYLAWSNSYTRLLGRLGDAAPTQSRGGDLASYLAEKARTVAAPVHSSATTGVAA